MFNATAGMCITCIIIYVYVLLVLYYEISINDIFVVRNQKRYLQNLLVVNNMCYFLEFNGILYVYFTMIHYIPKSVNVETFINVVSTTKLLIESDRMDVWEDIQVKGHLFCFSFLRMKILIKHICTHENTKSSRAE
jgi:hypothetical protein